MLNKDYSDVLKRKETNRKTMFITFIVIDTMLYFSFAIFKFHELYQLYFQEIVIGLINVSTFCLLIYSYITLSKELYSYHPDRFNEIKSALFYFMLIEIISLGFQILFDLGNIFYYTDPKQTNETEKLMYRIYVVFWSFYP